MTTSLARIVPVAVALICGLPAAQAQTQPKPATEATSVGCQPASAAKRSAILWAVLISSAFVDAAARLTDTNSDGSLESVAAWRRANALASAWCLPAWTDAIAATRVLERGFFQSLFPGSELWVERLAGFPKSYAVFRT